MTSENEMPEEGEKQGSLEEICQNLKGIRRTVDKILEQLKENYDALRHSTNGNSLSWRDLYGEDENYF